MALQKVMQRSSLSVLREKDVTKYLINTGGNIKSWSWSKKNNTWRVGIEEPVKMIVEFIKYLM